MAERGADEAHGALRAVLGALLPGWRLEGAAPLGRGHIHDTWLASGRDDGGSRARYVVQRVNTQVFRDPEALARNLECVTAHVRTAQRSRGVADLERSSLRLVRSPGGQTLERDPEGRPWRAFPFVEGTRSLDAPASPAQAERAARAFGGFLADLADLAPERLVETIPGFHDLDGRRAALERAARDDAADRAAGVGPELEEARRTAERLAGARGLAPDALPRRVVHNDCKLNNLLFDAASGEALCVVDLDTVMPGSAIFDFGELARTGVGRAREDEPDRARVDLALFAALARGFVAGARGLLVEAEVCALALAGPRMALENGVRFLTDHLDGDRYFRVARPGHNLDRARAQLRLAARLLELEGELRRICDALVPSAGRRAD